MLLADLIALATGLEARWLDHAPLGNGRGRPLRIYYANHQSHMDTAVIWSALPRALRERTRPVAAEDFWAAGPIRRWIAARLFNAVLIARKRVNRRNNPLVPLLRALDEGSSLILFPEGTRRSGNGGSIGPFKPGLWHVHRHRPTAELVPVFVENNQPWWSRFLPVPLVHSLTFGPPLPVREGEDKQEFLDRARAALVEVSQRVLAERAR